MRIPRPLRVACVAERVAEHSPLQPPPLARADLGNRPASSTTRRRPLAAEQWLHEAGGTRWIVKDFSGHPWWVRWTTGAWLIRREYAVMTRLRGLPGIPQQVLRIDRLTLAYPCVEGTPLASTPARQLSPDFFRRYEALLDELHARGIAHLDLNNEASVLVTPDQRPVLLNFRFHLAFPRPFTRLTHWLAWFDLRAFNRAWNRYLLQQLQDEQMTIRRSRAA